MANMNKKSIIGIIGGVLITVASVALGVACRKKHAGDENEVVVTDYEECSTETAEEEAE